MAANVRFAFAPALAIEGLLDYSKSEHVKIFRGAIKPVSETPFDCEADGLHRFLKDVHDRADEMGWTREFCESVQKRTKTRMKMFVRT
jgi:hypothetical protein